MLSAIQKSNIKKNRKNFLKNLPWAEISILSFFGILIVWFILWFILSSCHNNNKPEHIVRIEYTVYDVPGGSNRSGNYKVKGEKFIAVKHSYQGTNTLKIKDADNSGVQVNGQSVTVYVGTSDVRQTNIRIVK